MPDPPPNAYPLSPQQLHAAAVLDAWTAMEVLSPLTFDRPDELLAGQNEELVRLEAHPGGLPWHHPRNTAADDLDVVYFYKILLGAQRLDPGWAALQEKFPAMRDGEREDKRFAPLASIVVNEKGCLVEGNWVSVASFAWGLPRALADQLDTLRHWPIDEIRLIMELETTLLPALLAEPELDQTPMERNEIRKTPLEWNDLLRGYQFLLKTLQLPEAWVEQPEFAVRVEVPKRRPKPGQTALPETPPEPLLINGFLLTDLQRARRLCVQQGCEVLDHNLGRYLGCIKPDTVQNLLTDQTALEQALQPRLTPLAKWPAAHNYSLSLLQQAAVNLAFAETAPTGILGINGPPGTGKTTLVREILAEIVTQRAMVMCNFENPAQAFRYSGLEHHLGGGINVEMFWLAPELKGFEAIIASSNNRAVENVSAELPGMAAIHAQEPPFTYLKTLGDSLHQMETWGAVAAVLGNSRNRNRFVNRFWWDDETGLRRYLSAACGLPYEVPVYDSNGTRTQRTRPPEIVIKEKPPKSQQEAMERWQQAQQEFRDALKKSSQCQAWLDKCRDSLHRQSQLQAELAVAETALQQNTEALKATQALATEIEAAFLNQQQRHVQALELRTQITDAQQAKDTAKARCQLAEARQTRHQLQKPTVLKMALQKSALADWEVQRAQHQLEVAEAAQNLVAANRFFQSVVAGLAEAASADPSVLEEELQALAERRNQVLVELATLEETTEKLPIQINSLKAEMTVLHDLLTRTKERPGTQFVDTAFWQRSHAELHLSSPWQPLEAQRARETLFCAALNLHKAFMDAAASPLRQNLTVLMHIFRTQTLSSAEKQALLPDLWSTLFLVVPLVSTTFASVSRMFGQLPPEALGWLIVDEAAQATPQAAVGAIFRTKRIVVLGDPVQLEPVVSLPRSLVQHICGRFGVDADVYAAPQASVQSLADSASRYMAEFRTDHRHRRVGVPLLVHRRCSEPMFSVANQIAYANQMVSAKEPQHSQIQNVLGKSRWIQVKSAAPDKWSQQEGFEALRLLQQLRNARIQPNLYLVTPFVAVAKGLRSLVLKSNILEGWLQDNESPQRWVYNRIGTLHTAQGREAEAIILVLGAPNADQTGARTWAGQTPNLLNVALTRAREAIYVIGNHDHWQGAGVFRELVYAIRSGK